MLQWPETAAIIAVIISLISLFWQLILYLLKRKPELDISIQIYLGNKKDDLNNDDTKRLTMIKCRLGNRGNYRLDIERAKLIIDEGTNNIEQELEFPNIWQWKEKCPDCELSKWYQNQKNKDLYPGYVEIEEIKDKFTYCSNLVYFSDAIEYVLPREYFYDSKILFLDFKRYYRVVFLVIPKPIKYFFFFQKKIDCLCVYEKIPAGNYRKVN